MDALILMLGMVAGLFFVYIATAHTQKSTPQPSTRQHPPFTGTAHEPYDLVPDVLRSILVRRRFSEPLSYPPVHLQSRNEPLNSNKILEDWRKSILGLIKLAENNLQIAECYFTTMNYKEAVDAAATSVENISRALLHCYGEKPYPNSDQEEPLRIVARRLQGEEKVRFEKTVDEVVQIYHNKIFLTCLLENGTQVSLLDKERTRQTVEIARKVVFQFRRIMEEHFGMEIAELSEKCPRCGALSISLWAFNIKEATNQCNICRHKWIQPRNL